MTSKARLATRDDLDILESLYRGLEKEMTGLHSMWPLADGLAEPIRDALESEMAHPDTLVVIGEIDGYPLGFLVGRTEEMLPQAGSERLGSIRLVFVDPEAREVGIGEAMRDFAIGRFREQGLTRFDAHVLPGHRLVKNFFEAGGFSARSIIMHHDDASG
jgi:ribosomal protein S18 acetylase RimI-like enzyme